MGPGRAVAGRDGHSRGDEDHEDHESHESHESHEGHEGHEGGVDAAVPPDPPRSGDGSDDGLPGSAPRVPDPGAGGARSRGDR
ncbi:hypothetical protein [Streptomyces spongiicola]|uniref:hypothetical protein n=1 Tax=Streptomyces spongiicola TaxID=1690221 RepID=UPI001C2B9584|nr:hypothetical protein [Streptomyces spongiicola]